MSAGSALPGRGWEWIQMLSRYPGVKEAGEEELKKYAAVSRRWIKLVI